MNVLRMGLIILAFKMLSLNAEAQGVLKKLAPNQKDQDTTRVSKEAAAEALITQTEEKALSTLESILKKSKGKANEPDLWLRRGELYMRRAKSARFFEFQREDVEKAASFVPPMVRDQNSRKLLVQANRSYLKVFNEFKSHPRADQALYTFAFNLEQLGESEKAIIYYSQLVSQYPNSTLAPDSYLALGEIYFNKIDFPKALEHFDRVTKFKNSRAFWYAEYKKGWVHYNMKNNDQAMAQLVFVITKAPIESERISLRDEAIKDSTLFFSESRKAEEAYSFYSELIRKEDELINTLLRLSNLYNRHSRYEDANLIYLNILKKHKDPELQAKVLTKQSNMYLSDKAFVKSSQSLELAVKVCTKIEFKSSECEIDLPEIQTKLIKNMWASLKKNPGDHEGRKELEKQIKAALSSSKTPETRYKFTSLLGDFYYEIPRYQDSGEQYFLAFQVKPSETSLLAAIDAMTLASKSDKKARPKLVLYIDTYTQTYPQGEKAIDLRIKKVAIHLNEKQPELAKAEIEYLTLQKKMTSENQLLVEDLYFDYLNQVQDFGTLLVVVKKAAEQTSNPQRQSSLSKVVDEITLKVAEDSISKSTSIAQKKDVITTLGDIAIQSKTLDLKDKKAAHLLAIKEAYNGKLYLLALKFSQAFISAYPNDPATLDIRKSSLKLALELGDLRGALSLSQELLANSQERDRSPLIKSILELQQAIGNQSELRAFADKNLNILNPSDRSSLFKYFWESANQSGDRDFISWTQQNIQKYNIEPLASEIQLFQIENLVSQKKYEEAFSKSKKYMGSQLPPEVRSRARLIQARIFEKELFDIGSKTRMERLQLVISIKTERLEKAQKAYNDVIRMSDEGSSTYFEGHLGLERTLGEYVRYLNELEIKNSNPSEVEQIKSALTEIGQPLKKKLETVRAQVSKLRLNQVATLQTQLQMNQFEILTEQMSFEPTLDSKVSQLFPALVLGHSINCKVTNDPNSIGFKSCLAASTDLKKVTGLLEQAQGYEFAKGELAYLRSFEASHNKRIKEATYLLNLAIAQNPSEVAFQYQLGRHLLASDNLTAGLNQLHQAYLNGMTLENLKLVNIMDGYLQNNCYKALAFADSVKSISGAPELLSSILSECHAKTGNTKDAIKALDSISKPTLYHHLQYARIYEDHIENLTLAESHYGKALHLAPAGSIKVWLNKKISYLKAQAQVKKADRGRSEGLKQ